MYRTIGRRIQRQRHCWKIDVDENNEATTKYGIRNIPTILFIKNGQVVDKIVGAADKRLFVDKINKLL